MIPIGTVESLWRYPVSSVTGEKLESCEIRPDGLPGDRRFGLVERATGAPARPEQDKRWHPALDIASRIADDGETQLRIGEGPWLPVMAPDLASRLEAHFGFEVELRPYENRNPPPGYSGAWAVNRYEPNALHLLTTASQARLQRLHPSGNPDERRFRPNIVVSMAEVDGEFPEAGWIGRTVVVADLSMIVERPTRRCGFTLIPQNGLPEDSNILRHLVRSNGHNMGVYCLPSNRASIALGDKVWLSD
jgi:uncharacterized protein YcbX